MPTPYRSGPRLARLAAAAGLILGTACTTDLPTPVVDAPAPTQAPAVVGDATAAPPATTPPADPEPVGRGFGAYLAARHAQSIRDLDSAAEFFGAALAEDPDNIALQQQTYMMLAIEGDLDAAAALARRVMDRRPGDPLPSLVVAIDLFQKQDYQGAIDSLDGLAETGLNALMLPLIRSWAHAALDRPDDALAALGPMGEQAELAPLYSFHAGLISDLTGRTEAAGGFYNQTIDSPGGDSLRATEVVVSFLQRSGETARAAEIVQRYLNDHPNSAIAASLGRRAANGPLPMPVASPQAGLAEALFGLATTVQQGVADETALLFVRLALALDPEFDLARMLLGSVLENQERWDDAVAVYRSIDAGSDVAYSARLAEARALERTGEVDGAVAILRESVAAHPDRADAAIDLGEVLRINERFAEAAEAYDIAIARKPDITEDDWTLLYSRGISLERSDQWERAEADFLRALELKPDQPLVLNYLGYSWLEMGRNIDRARAMVEKAVEQRPTDGYIVDSLGWALYLQGDYEEAVKHLERAVELVPGDPIINDHLGDALWRVGRRVEAQFQWRRALSLDPDPEDAAKTREKLENGLPDPPDT